MASHVDWRGNQRGFFVRKMGILVAVIATAVLLAAPARASIIVSGTTQGCFGGGCTPGASATDVGLTFSGASSFFTQTDATGFASISKLGTFTLDATPNVYSGDVFTLEVDFTFPSANAGLFDAILKGSVTAGPSGGVLINFSPDTQSFNFPGGSFSLQINPGSVQPTGNPLLITAQVQAVPEPGTWALMGIGFACLGLMAYRRRGREVTLRLV
jgi:hypothetical protein